MFKNHYYVGLAHHSIAN